VVLVNPGRIDTLAVRLSEVENIPLLTTSHGPSEVLDRLGEL
jgi:predicted transcriptional regulator